MKADIDFLFEVFKRSNSVRIDSRQVIEGDLFFAFKGKLTDGHKYVESVLAMPGTYCVIDDPSFDAGDRTLLVEDTLTALQQLASAYRDTFEIPVIGITGSNGKTTSKELIMAVLETKYKIHYTKGNYNNHIGVPLTILSADENIDIMIVEMGANKLGDIEELCDIADPSHGLITNIGKAHIEGFGSEENILIGKTEMYRYLEASEGTIFLNKYDSKLLSRLPENTDTELYPIDGVAVKNNGLYLTIENEHSEQSYDINLYGIYNSMNIHAALKIGSYFDIDLDTACEAIAQYTPSMNRSQVVHRGNTTLILDAYNANPSSMELSIKQLISYQGDRKKILCLGDMLELGSDEVKMHKAMLDLVKGEDIDELCLVGPIFKMADTEQHHRHFNNSEELKAFAIENMHLFENAVILVKGSRSIQLEKFSNIFSDGSIQHTS